MIRDENHIRFTPFHTVLRYLSVIGLIGVAIYSPFAHGESPEAFFRTHVLPVLEKNCFECHSHGLEIRGGFSMDSRKSLLNGGFSGAVIDLDSPSSSLLLKAVRHEIPDLKMPNKREKLKPGEIEILEKWVALGLPDNREVTSLPNSPKDHWAFKKVHKPDVPNLPESIHIKNPVDAFVGLQLGQNTMSFAPEAAPRILARRLAFDLTGLPPEMDDVEMLEASLDAGDFERAYKDLVEKYLANPGFGERWGRHWLDIARYADTRGYVFTSERRFPYSYTYRDYVIAAFNNDKPYNQFVKEQIAADRMVEETGDKSSLAALGFLTLGRSFLNNKHDIIDDRIDVVTRGFMGLTVVCARCHDHKYDPIPTADYYSLYGVFDSTTTPPEYPLLDFDPNDPKYLEFQSLLKEKQAAHTDYESHNQQAIISEARKKSDLYFKIFAAARNLNSSQREDEARKVKIHPLILNRWHTTLLAPDKLKAEFWKPWNALIHISDSSEFKTKAKEIASSFQSTQESESPGFSGWRTLVDAFISNPPEGADQLVALYGSMLSQSVTDPADAKPHDLSAIREWLESSAAPPSIRPNEATSLFDVPIRNKVRSLKREVEKHLATHPGAPPRGMTLVDKPTPVEPVIFERGSSGRRGKQVPRQFLEILSPNERKPFASGSGRREMAEMIASEHNPLTARVFVNRVWSHLIGKPMVSTPSDFGVRSEQPTHPQLLDWLASDFIDHNWSMKSLMRTILLSRTYRQQSFRSPGFTHIDPENKLIWKMNRKRLEFEPMRDQALHLSGELVHQFGGLPVKIYEEPFEPRRTIYGFIERQNLPGVLRTFDFASPDTTSPRRFTTMVPQQSLFLMNNSWFQKRAEAFANRMIPSQNSKLSDSDNARISIQKLFHTIFQRDPSPEEWQWCMEFISQDDQTGTKSGSSMSPLAQLAQALMMSNEAMFVD